MRWTGVVALTAFGLAACEDPARSDVGLASERAQEELPSERLDERMQATEELQAEQAEEREEVREQQNERAGDLWEGPEEALDADEPREPEVQRP